MAAGSHAKRRDANEPAIIDALRKQAVGVAANDTGKGQPDLTCCYRHVYFLLEVKVPGEKLNKVQQEYHDKWPGKIYIATTPQEAIACAMAAWVERMNG